jgi:hypothetical protein
VEGFEIVGRGVGGVLWDEGWEESGAEGEGILRVDLGVAGGSS